MGACSYECFFAERFILQIVLSSGGMKMDRHFIKLKYPNACR